MLRETRFLIFCFLTVASFMSVSDSDKQEKGKNTIK